MLYSTITDITMMQSRRSRTRPRSDDLFKPSNNVIKMKTSCGSSSSSSIGALSRITGSTEESYTMSEEYEFANDMNLDNDDNNSISSPLSQDIPSEVVIIHDDEEDSIPTTRCPIVNEDIERRMQMYETVIVSYKQKVRSSESMNSSLHKYLRQTQGYAENLMSEREELLEVIQDMEQEDNRRIDQELVLKFIMCTALIFNLFGGSHLFLVASVVLQLVCTFVSMVV